MGQTQLTPAQAKEQVYAVAREIIAAVPAKYYDIEVIYFDYESGNDDGSPPFRAVVDIVVNTKAPYDNEHITDIYRDLLVKLPGYTSNGDLHSHSPVIYKDDMFICLSWRTFEINGPLAVYADLRKIPDHWDNDGAHGPLHAQDVTSDFYPLKKTIGSRVKP